MEGVWQAGQEADEETQNWLDSMMSNKVAAKASSGAGGDLVSSLGALRAPKPRPEDRAMRKTLIMRTGTSEVRPHCLAPPSSTSRSLPCQNTCHCD